MSLVYINDSVNFHSVTAASWVRIAFYGLTINFYIIWFLGKVVVLSIPNSLQQTDLKLSDFWLRNGPFPGAMLSNSDISPNSDSRLENQISYKTKLFTGDFFMDLCTK